MGPQILWAGLELLGPEDDVEEKENEEEKKNSFLSFFVSAPRLPSVTVPASCALTESRNYSLVGIIVRFVGVVQRVCVCVCVLCITHTDTHRHTQTQTHTHTHTHTHTLATAPSVRPSTACAPR